MSVKHNTPYALEYALAISVAMLVSML
jgi:hypothetical protein